MTLSTDTTSGLVRAYYESWQHGIASYDAGRLRSVLAGDLLFEGPIAGTRTGVEPFLCGLADFARSLKALRMLQQINDARDSAALYDCDLGPTAGTLRFAEFLCMQHNRIQSIRLVYDPAEFKRLCAPS